MKKYLIAIFCLAPSLASATNSYLYSGIDLSVTKVEGKAYSADVLLALGLNVAIDGYNSFALEAGVQERDEAEGVLLKGSVLYRRNITVNRKYLPYVAGGVSRVTLASQKCGYSLTSTNPVPTYSYLCNQNYSNSNGITVEAGINIRLAKRRYLIIKASSFKGGGDTRVNLIGIGGTF
ncbi:MAG TPA: hypothetical protein ENK35_11065 [Candidatus Tenderia sp.]|nr:hypothetical protein [Candidatus Tenderia sp.]